MEASAASTNPAMANTSSDNGNHIGVVAADSAVGGSEAVERSSTNSVLDLAIGCWDNEFERTTAPIMSDEGAHHTSVIGESDRCAITTADTRLDALRERVLARISGKQLRLDTG